MLELTKRAREVLDLLLDGYEYKDIGRILGLSSNTCANHIKLAAKKNNMDLADLAYRYAREK